MKIRNTERFVPAYLFAAAAIGTAVLLPEIAFGSVEASLAAIQTRLITTILPLVAILGLVFAGISLVMGNPNAKGHFMLALVGAGIGFGAPSLVAFVRGLIQ